MPTETVYRPAGQRNVFEDLKVLMRSIANSSEHLDYVATLLDDMWSIPGTKIRFGLDGLIGWIPGIGDAAAGVASCIIIFASWRRGVRPITLARMAANVLLESTVGAVPILGDVFHIVWKANRRNYRLLMREKEEPGRNTQRDWLFFALLVVAAIAVIAIPVGIVVWAMRREGW
jgi:hypothetical protein